MIILYFLVPSGPLDHMSSPGATGAMHGGPPGPVSGPLPGYPPETHSDVPVKVERIAAASTGKSKLKFKILKILN